MYTCRVVVLILHPLSAENGNLGEYMLGHRAEDWILFLKNKIQTEAYRYMLVILVLGRPEEQEFKTSFSYI